MVEKNFWLARISKKYAFWDTLLRGKCKTAYGHSHKRPSVGGLEIDIIENGGQHSLWGVWK